MKRYKTLNPFINEAFAFEMRLPNDCDISKQSIGGTGDKHPHYAIVKNTHTADDKIITLNKCQKCGVSNHKCDEC